jgi:hypothetical protein
MPSQPKQPWNFDRNLVDPELRKIRALEHGAHYLDLIEGHLAKIAASLTENGPKDIALSIALANIAEAIKPKAKL